MGGARVERERERELYDALARTKLSLSLARSLALLADRFTTSPSNTIPNVLRRIFRGSQDFLSPSTDRRAKDPSRCS